MSTGCHIIVSNFAMNLSTLEVRFRLQNFLRIHPLQIFRKIVRNYKRKTSHHCWGEENVTNAIVRDEKIGFQRTADIFDRRKVTSRSYPRENCAH